MWLKLSSCEEQMILYWLAQNRSFLGCGCREKRLLKNGQRSHAAGFNDAQMSLGQVIWLCVYKLAKTIARALFSSHQNGMHSCWHLDFNTIGPLISRSINNFYCFRQLHDPHTFLSRMIFKRCCQNHLLKFWQRLTEMSFS